MLQRTVFINKIRMLQRTSRNNIVSIFYAFIMESSVIVLTKERLYRVIHKSLRDFRPMRYGSRDVHAEGQQVNRGRDTPNFCPTLQVLNMSTLGDAADVNPTTHVHSHSACKCVAGT